MDFMMILPIFMYLVFISAQEQSSLDKFSMAPRAAKSLPLIRVKRSCLDILRSREATREGRQSQAQAQLARECPTKCWTDWGAFGPCNMPCGGSGFKTQTRIIKTPQELGTCKDWVAANGCPGPTSRTAACNRFCHNQATPNANGCSCTAGWKDQCCGTRILCPDPGKPANGLVTPGGSGLHYGTVVSFSCHTGYRMAGPSASQCVGSGTWSNYVPICNVIQCPTPQPPQFSQLELISGTAFVYGSLVQFVCNRGYSLSGTAVRQCEANGQWSGTEPSCAQILCPTLNAPSNGGVTFPGGNTVDSQAAYTCNAGYFLQGTAFRKCQSNGQWTGQVPSCQTIECNNVMAPPQGYVTLEGTSGSKIQYGGKAQFTCTSGYVLIGSSVITCGGTGQQGTWSAAVPTCQPVNCGDPGTLPNGVKAGAVYTLGASVSFNCVAGHRLSGATSIRCQNNGGWSASKPHCLVCGPDTYKVGTNAETLCTPCPAHSTTSGVNGATSGTICICSAGYRGAPGGPCNQISCPALPTPQHSTPKSCSTNYGGKCQFECNAGHVVSEGDIARTCSESGAWSGQNLVCTACPVNTYRAGVSQCTPCPANSVTSDVANEKSGCRCISGWTGPNGGPCQDVNECQNQNGGCQQQCINSVGSYRCECNLPGFIQDADDQMKCNRKNQCSAMQRPSNGGLVCHSHLSTSTERCQVTCNPGYEHFLSPNAFEQCGPSTNWKWSHEISDKPILDCFEVFFEGIQYELDVFYFTSQCHQLTSVQKAQMKQQFVDYLISNGICRAAGASICQIDDVTVECASANRRRRSAMEQIKISFKLKSMAQSKSKMDNCNAACESSVMARTRAQLMQETVKAEQILTAQTGAQQPQRNPNIQERFRPDIDRNPAEILPMISLGGVNLYSSSVTQGEVTTSCSGNMVKSGDTCVTCPSGSYKVESRDECSLCPIGSYQPLAGQIMCLPCIPANIRGSKSC